jgi:hypothetical protein
LVGLMRSALEQADRRFVERKWLASDEGLGA